MCSNFYLFLATASSSSEKVSSAHHGGQKIGQKEEHEKSTELRDKSVGYLFEL